MPSAPRSTIRLSWVWVINRNFVQVRFLLNIYLGFIFKDRILTNIPLVCFRCYGHPFLVDWHQELQPRRAQARHGSGVGGLSYHFGGDFELELIRPLARLTACKILILNLDNIGTSCGNSRDSDKYSSRSSSMYKNSSISFLINWSVQDVPSDVSFPSLWSRLIYGPLTDRFCEKKVKIAYLEVTTCIPFVSSLTIYCQKSWRVSHYIQE